jgi:hypothetical protein
MPSGSCRDIDKFGALQKSLRTAAMASVKAGAVRSPPQGDVVSRQQTAPAMAAGDEIMRFIEGVYEWP